MRRYRKRINRWMCTRRKSRLPEEFAWRRDRGRREKFCLRRCAAKSHKYETRWRISFACWKREVFADDSARDLLKKLDRMSPVSRGTGKLLTLFPHDPEFSTILYNLPSFCLPLRRLSTCVCSSQQLYVKCPPAIVHQRSWTCDSGWVTPRNTFFLNQQQIMMAHASFVCERKKAFRISDNKNSLQIV